MGTFVSLCSPISQPHIEYDSSKSDEELITIQKEILLRYLHLIKDFDSKISLFILRKQKSMELLNDVITEKDAHINRCDFVDLKLRYLVKESERSLYPYINDWNISIWKTLMKGLDADMRQVMDIYFNEEDSYITITCKCK